MLFVWIFLYAHSAHHFLSKKVKKYEADFFKKYDDELLDYCFGRDLVICPTCREVYVVSCLEEQLTTEWCCACCGQHFEETPTHTIKR